MRRIHIILLPIMLVLLCANVFAQDSMSDRDKVTKSFIEVMTATYSVEGDVWNEFVGSSNHWMSDEKALRNLYTSSFSSDAEVERILKKFDSENGCFTDINYESKQRGVWAPARHLYRMESLAILYVAGPEKWRGSERLKTLLHAGMAFWFRTKPHCPNSWHNVVNAPRRISSIMMMLRDELTEEELEGGLKVLDACPLESPNTSTWRGGSNILRGILTNDDDLVLRARDDIAKKLRIVNHITGIHDDWSYQHHGAQVQFGNYGILYFEGVSFWCRVLAGTKYEFTDEQTQIVYNFVKEGLRRCVFKGVFDPSFCGRQVFINAGRAKVCSFASSAQNMAAAMRDMASRAVGETAERYRAEATFYEDLARRNLYLTDADSDVNGAKYFNRSDCGIYRTKDWYSSVRMHSERTIGFEFTNKENTLANFSADGAVLIMQDGGEYENIFACWDWRKVPGVTAYDDGKEIKCVSSVAGRRNKTTHVGGLTAQTSVGDVMAASMELIRDGLHAFKSNFFFGDCIICIGSDIRINKSAIIDVTTAIDQTRLRGEVVCGKSGGGKGSNKGVRWVHHNNRGYVSLDGSPINVSKETQKGKWDFIQPHFKDKWDEMPIFKCWFDHPVGKLRGGKSGSYAYAILPCTSASDTEAFEREVSKGGKRASVRVLSNTADCQAVSHNGVVCAVLHKAGSYKLDGETVESEKPCIIIREGDNVSTEYFEEEMADVVERVLARVSLRGIKNLRDEAVKNVRTAVNEHFREDVADGTWHLVGENSSWSMEQAWKLCGYTAAYRRTKDKKLRSEAVNVADYLLSVLPEDGIPYKELAAPNVPNGEKDVYAAAVIADALIELSGYSGSDDISRYVNVARRILRTLASDECLAGDAPLTSADYFLLEALMRCSELKI